MLFADAVVLVRSITSAITQSSETGSGFGSGSAPCSRVSSSNSFTRRPIRADS
ncbi:hypothetical protein Aph02nite_60710 [Actinoplanes philippinensis]|uniref:Uncharacterized protein n=1 Tax=Actinoplanes philippinensis TaxID=35752 RepID=A0A1I2JLS7_9ACTN|nr:hypothetical protein Aph02nite_60710 [Actinoplanes philippinensis]SFF53621.1 hypothetical protein SAMN05421541_112281 [Actinoplanes philippinensis]